MKALVYGGTGGLAQSLIAALKARDWDVETASRETGRYSDYAPKAAADAVFLPQALFVKKPTAAMTDAEIEDSVTVGLTDIIRTLRNLLAADTDRERRVDYAVIGSTSAYAGFAGTAVYCAVKHGLLGLVRALNDEYAGTGKRFWLFSMGTMDTEMGRLLADQDPASFLSPDAVAERIVSAIAIQDNLFEPEVIIRRRTIRFREA